MKEKKVNRVLLYLLGFLRGHSAVVGMHPFMVPMLAAVYSIRQSTFGLFAAMLFGGAVMYGIGGWNAGSFFQMGPYVMGEQQLPVISIRVWSAASRVFPFWGLRTAWHPLIRSRYRLRYSV